VHHDDDVRELITHFGYELWYLPTYSPDLNPIEHLFAKIKAFIKSHRPDTAEKLVEAFCAAVKSIASKDVYNAFRHCGYNLDQ
jgi:transposase